MLVLLGHRAAVYTLRATLIDDLRWPLLPRLRAESTLSGRRLELSLRLRLRLLNDSLALLIGVVLDGTCGRNI